ncbi:hypothetical protein [Rhizobium sp. F40D2]|uniref:hypothetical protein n=1 Tax=Rhizobium sp. F40D2 TaxID=3453141 RepID=UPI003F26C70A
MTRLVETGLFDPLERGEIELLPRRGTALAQGALARRWDHAIQNGCTWMAFPRHAEFRAFFNIDQIVDVIPLSDSENIRHRVKQLINVDAAAHAQLHAIDVPICGVDRSRQYDESSVKAGAGISDRSNATAVHRRFIGQV